MFDENGIALNEDICCASGIGGALDHAPENVVATIGYEPKGSFSDKKKIKGFDGEVAAMSEQTKDKILNIINESFPKVGSLQTDSKTASDWDKQHQKRSKERYKNTDPVIDDVPIVKETEDYGYIHDPSGNIIHDGIVGLEMYDKLFKEL